jgi:hypothetical protein
MTVTGTGYETTQPFKIPSSQWTLSWTITGDPQYASLTFFEISVEGAQGGSETVSYVYAGPGDYYLKVLDANTTWTATIEQTAA